MVSSLPVVAFVQVPVMSVARVRAIASIVVVALPGKVPATGIMLRVAGKLATVEDDYAACIGAGRQRGQQHARGKDGSV